MESEFDLKAYLIENTLTPQSAGQLAYEKKDPDGVEVGSKEVKTGDRATKLATLQKALRQVEAKKNELVSKHKAGELPIEQYKQAIGDIPEKIKLLRGGIAKLERKLSLDETDEGLDEGNSVLTGLYFAIDSDGDDLLGGDKGFYFYVKGINIWYSNKKGEKLNQIQASPQEVLSQWKDNEIIRLKPNEL